MNGQIGFYKSQSGVERLSSNSEAGSSTTPLVCLGVAGPYRQAVYVALEETRITPVAPENPEQWAATDGGLKIVVIMPREDADWATIESLSGLPEVLVVVITPDLAVEQFARALALGSDGVVHSDTTAEIIVSVIESALHGEVVLPVGAAQLMAKTMRHEAIELPAFGADELELLRELAAGSTVVELAREIGWSERTLRRRLQSVYIKLGATNRSQAIANAGRYGMFD